MTISNYMQWITNSKDWKLYTNRSYRAKIQKADPTRIYNIPGKPGVVYNYLEDSYELVGFAYVVTGIAGEMWPIGESALLKYHISPEEITTEPIEVDTVELDTVYAAIQIPKKTPFTLEVDYGEKALLHGNRDGIPHGGGDFVLIPTKVSSDGGLVPDFEGNGRIVNGAIFEKLYKPFE